jgi:hypothetical protein
MRIERYMKILCGKTFIDDITNSKTEVNIFDNLDEYLEKELDHEMIYSEEGGSQEIEAQYSDDSQDRNKLLDRFKSKVIDIGMRAEQEEAMQRA